MNLLDDYFSLDSNKRNKAQNEIYKIINSRCSIYNYDEIDLLIRKYHKDKKLYKHNEILYYYELLSKISKSFISHRDGKIILKYWESKSDNFLDEYNGLNKIAMWNTLNREINIDVLVFQYMLDNGMEDYRYLQCYNSIVHIEDLQLERVLSKGIADTHMHIGAGIDFEISWHNLMNTEIKMDKHENYNILDISIGEGIENDTLKIYRHMAIIYRVILSKYIFSYDYKGFETFLNNYMIYNDSLGSLIIKILKFDESIVNNIKFIMKDIKVLMNAYKDDKDDKYDKYSKQYFYKANNSDFLSSILKYVDKEIDTSLENIFIFESLKYINKNSCKDILFCDVLYKYLLIKNIFFRVSTQDNFIKGLNRFSLSYKRSTRLFDEKNLIYLVLRTQIKNRNLEKLEIRSSFPNTKNERNLRRDMKKSLKEFFKVYSDLIKHELNTGNNYNQMKIPQIGIVYSFKKFKDEGNKCWLEHSERTDYTKLNYENNRLRYMNQLNTLIDLRESIPYLSNYIVGIDASSIENNTEPWVFSTIFKKARNSNRKISILSDRKVEYKNIDTLGFTFHVGEEFRHILSGLRHIDEVVEHLNFKAGDRIGHGIALGIDINKWVQNNSITILPRIEYLENLLWIWGILTKEKTKYNGDINYIERKIISEAVKVYFEYGTTDLRGINIYMLYDAYLNKFKDTNINDRYKKYKTYEYYDNYIFCKNIADTNKGNWDNEKIVHSNHCSLYLERMMEPIEVVIEDNDLELFKFIQHELKNKISREGIIVETNPTSNRSIGELDNIFEHYISNLNNVNKKNDDNIMVSINTDDPCVFNTNINNEYAYIFYSLLRKGYDRGICLEWIEKVRTIAIEQSFIKTRKLTKDELISELEQVIELLN